MQLIFNTPITEEDRLLLARLLDVSVPSVGQSVPAAAEAAAVLAKVAKKETKVAPVPEPEEELEAHDTEEPEEEDEDVLGGGVARTPKDALDAATELVSKGGAAKVKAALATVNTKRVGELKAEDVEAFFAALEA